MNYTEERLNLIKERVDLQHEKSKLSESIKEFENEKLNFLTEKELILQEISDIKDKYDKMEQELNDLEEISNICRICYKNQKVKLSCCSGGICYHCWYEQELRKKPCPYCRSPLPNLVDILINKIDKLNL